MDDAGVAAQGRGCLEEWEQLPYPPSPHRLVPLQEVITIFQKAKELIAITRSHYIFLKDNRIY